MKMVSAILTTLCLVSILWLASMRVSVKAENKTWTVNCNGPGDFASIREAVASYNVGSGDTIFVHNGIYNESVEINKSISLVGEDSESTIINGYAEASYVVAINSVNGVSIQNFTITKSGVKLSDSGINVVSSGSLVRYNKIIGISEGIMLYSSINNVISGNTIIFNNDTGITMYFSTSNWFIDNVISNNQWGISLSFSARNVFSGNTIAENEEGVNIYSHSTLNAFYHNNFVGNTHHATTDGSINYWSNFGEGNYWSNYTAQDDNKDGVSNLPYIIDLTNVDNNPLSGMFSDFNIVSANEAYQVDVISNSTVSGFSYEIGIETGNKVVKFDVYGEEGTVGFSRVAIPTSLMNYSLVLVGGDEVTPTLFSRSDSQDFMYFTYPHTNQTVAIISSMTYNLYEQLRDSFQKLEADWNMLNLNYLDLLSRYGTLLDNYSQLQQSYVDLNASYQNHLTDYSKDLENVKNLMYIFAGTTGVFIVSTGYLSRRKHGYVATPGETK